VLPLWLVALATTAEGFPRPPVSVEIAGVALTLAVLVSLVLLWKRWLTVELLVYSFAPLALVVLLDEISTAYKTPFIFASALVLTIGAVIYQRSGWPRWLRGLILLAFAAAMLLLAAHAASAFWTMASDRGYDRCFPDQHGCPPLTDDATPWWLLYIQP